MLLCLIPPALPLIIPEQVGLDMFRRAIVFTKTDLKGSRTKLPYFILRMPVVVDLHNYLIEFLKLKIVLEIYNFKNQMADY
jgi:hypothetical protein